MALQEFKRIKQFASPPALDGTGAPEEFNYKIDSDNNMELVRREGEALRHARTPSATKGIVTHPQPGCRWNVCRHRLTPQQQQQHPRGQ
uniref:FMN_dh domain-containing protein n=1 Tax=Globodera pallida TaxID=36090 RepID=A0A183CG14_GLOPA